AQFLVQIKSLDNRFLEKMRSSGGLAVSENNRLLLEAMGNLHTQDGENTNKTIAKLISGYTDLEIATREAMDITMTTLMRAAAVTQGLLLVFLSAVALISPLALCKIIKVSQAQRDEERLRYELTSKGTGQGFYDWSVEDGWALLTAQFRDMLGYDTREEFPDSFEAFYAHLHPADRERVFKATEAHFRFDTPYDLQFRMRCRDGSYRWHRSKGVAVRDDCGKVLRLVGSHIDVTEFVETETRSLEKSRLKSDFYARMSRALSDPHEHLFDAQCDLLASGLAGEQSQLVRRMQKYTREAADLIDAIREYSQLEAKSVDVEQRQFRYNEIFERLRDQFETQFIENDIRLSIETIADGQALYHGDADLVTALLARLLRYALVNTSTASIDIILDIPVGGGQRIRVIDHGEGIDDIDLPHIFGKIFRHDDWQLENESTDKVTTALGLSIAHEIARLLQAEISVRSELGFGTCFSLVLPFAEVHRNASLPAPDTPYEPSETLAEPKTVLVVDHITARRGMLSRQLKWPEFSVSSVPNRERARVHLSQNHFDYILVDADMPRGDVENFVTSVTETSPESLVAVMVDEDNPERGRAFLDAGASGILTKPIDQTGLGEKLLAIDPSAEKTSAAA
ncbi:MAG: PAS domain-containing protein, partial [Pseudomonadota bacterium]